MSDDQKPETRVVVLPAAYDTPTGLAALLRHHGIGVEFMPAPVPAMPELDQALAEHDAWQLADDLGYTFRVLADGTIQLGPPADPDHCAICGGPHSYTVRGAVDAMYRHTIASLAQS